MGYVSPAAAWSGTIENILQRREEERLQRQEKARQDMLDQHKIRQDEAVLKLRQDELDQRRQDRERDDADRKELQRDKIAERKQARYEKTTAGMKPGDVLTPDMAQTAIDTGNESDLTNPKQGLRDFMETLPVGSPARAGVAAQTATPSTQEMVQTRTPLRFVGSPAQREAGDKKKEIEAYIASLPPGQLKDAALFRLRTGGQEPAALTRSATTGSFEDYVQRKFGENPTSAQIEQARKAYQQADDRPINVGRDRFNVQQTTLADGTPGLLRTNLDTGETTSLKMPEGVTPGRQTATQRMTSSENTAALEGVSRIDSLMKTSKGWGDWVGPAAGRINQVSMQVPGTSVDPKMAEFFAEVASAKNRAIKAISGSQVTPSEQKRMMDQLPDITDKPEVLKEKLAATKRNIESLNKAMLPQSTAGAGGTSTGKKRIRYDINGNVLPD